jgi:hypothetical protein
MFTDCPIRFPVPVVADSQLLRLYRSISYRSEVHLWIILCGSGSAVVSADSAVPVVADHLPLWLAVQAALTLCRFGLQYRLC